MRPILAVVPQLPSGAFWLLVALTIGCAIYAVSRSAVRAHSGGAPGAGVDAPGASGESPLVAPLMVAAFGVMLLVVWRRNPITLHSYGLMLILGFAAATWLACREAQRRGIDPNMVLDLALPLLGWSIIACRALFVALDPEHFRSWGEMIRIWDGGLSFHGSLFAAPLVVAYYARRNKLRFGTLADVIAPSVFLGYAIARVGCFLNGCCYGSACDLPWAVQFHAEGRAPGILTEPSHPAQLYSSILALGMFWLMQRAKWSPRFNRFPGQLALLFFALYAVERAIVEIFRRGATAGTISDGSLLTQAQLFSVVMLVVVAVLWNILARRHEYSSTSANAPSSASATKA